MHTYNVNDMFYFHRRVYSSLSFITPVIIFTIVYNIPKFLELSVVTTYPIMTMNTSFSACAKKIFDDAELKSSSITPSQTMTHFLEDDTSTLVTNGSTIFPTFTSSNKKIYFSVEQIYHKYLKECCNCSRHDEGDDTYITENEDYKVNVNTTRNNGGCDIASICDVFISQLIEFLTSNISGKNNTNSSIFDSYVR